MMLATMMASAKQKRETDHGSGNVEKKARRRQRQYFDRLIAMVMLVPD
jgi:hypothetical protein